MPGPETNSATDRLSGREAIGRSTSATSESQFRLVIAIDLGAASRQTCHDPSKLHGPGAVKIGCTALETAEMFGHQARACVTIDLS